MSSQQQATLSFTALIDELRRRSAPDKHAAIDAVAVGADLAAVQRQLVDVVGRDVVNAAVLHLVGGAPQQGSAPASAAPAAVAGAAAGGAAGAGAPAVPEGSARLPAGMSQADVAALKRALSHAASCTAVSGCPDPDCAQMKGKLTKLRAHAEACRTVGCVLCQICHSSGAMPPRHEVCPPCRDPASATAGAESALASGGGGTAGDGGSTSAAAGTGEASRQREQRRVLLAHVFSCMHPQCSYPQCAPMRRKLHALVRAASTTLKR